MRRFILICVTLILAPIAAAHAQQPVTTRDIVELTKAGLSEEVLIALIEVHRPVFPVDTETLKGLKDSGVAPNVIIAMIKSGREMPVAPPAIANMTELEPQAVAPPPQVIFLERDHSDAPPPRVHYEERVREVVVPVYYPVTYPVASRPIHRSDRVDRTDYKPAAPVYWGFGGKLRPDAWKPTAADIQKDAKVPKEAQRK